MDQLVFLTKPRLAFRQRVAQTYFHSSILNQLALAGLDRAARRAPGNDDWGVRRVPAALVVGMNLLRICGSITHVSGCARDGPITLIQIKSGSDTGHRLKRERYRQRFRSGMRPAEGRKTRP